MSKCLDDELYDIYIEDGKQIIESLREIYEKGRADKEKEIKEKSVFYSNKPIEQIVLEARTDAIEEFLSKVKEEYPNDKNALYKLMYIAERLKEQKRK